MKVIVIFTCYNRKLKTENCIRSLVEGNNECQFEFVVVDDNSTDGTIEVLESMQKEYMIHIIKGEGGLYYSRGMRLGMQYVKKNYKEDFDYILLINDDVEFYYESIKKLIIQNEIQTDSVTVGATCNRGSELTYGAIKYISGISYKKVGIEDWDKNADTFNANCVLIPKEIFECVEIMDEHYVHSLGDFDYGMQIKRRGYQIYGSREYIGVCEINASNNTWRDTSLSRRERIRLKESVKGAPASQWFYFLKKNFGLGVAVIRSVTPYIRIMLKK